jgi:hypothetical protein
MVHNIVVKRVDISNAKTNLPHYSARLTSGDPRVGAAKDEFLVPDSFFEPLPDEILNAFRGE